MEAIIIFVVLSCIWMYYMYKNAPINDDFD